MSLSKKGFETVFSKEHLAEIASEFSIRPGVTFLNHGSFGLRANPVLQSMKHWADSMQQQPMDFFVRQLQPALENVTNVLAEFLNTTSSHLVLCHNATEAMNALANHLTLKPGDEVLLNNHEYGAVAKTWTRKCQAVGAKVVTAEIPLPLKTPDEITQAILQSVTPNTKLVVLSHITSPTAILLPIKKITRKLQEKGILVCIDGPHAIAQLDLDLTDLGADFYTASCHKWLAGPVGTGFLYVKDPGRFPVEPLVESWGVLPPNEPQNWHQRFLWQGTADPSCYLGIPAAIQFLKQIGLANVRTYCYQLAAWTKEYLESELKQEAVVPTSPDWITTMALVPLPYGDWSELQNKLWNQFQIEVPIIHFDNRYYVRVSCYLYNQPEQIHFLKDCLNQLLK